MRVLLVMYSMGSGGAERVMSILANEWARRGEAVRLITWSEGDSFYPLDEKVEFRSLGLGVRSKGKLDAVRNNLRQIAALREQVREFKPDAIVSFMNKNNVRTLLATRGLGVPVVVSERNDPNHDTIGNVWTRLVALSYPMADRLVVQSERAREFFPVSLRPKMRVVPNPVPVPPEGVAEPLAPGRKTMLAMGRLSEQKGFNLLIEAFGSIMEKHPDWDLEIWGEGNLRESLEKQAAPLGSRVRLPGRTTEAAARMRTADLFVLSSRYEGFPNVLVEAMAVNRAVVAYDCPNGPAEIIRPDEDGILVKPVGDVHALANALDRAMGDDTLRAQLASKAGEVRERFGASAVMKMWDEIVQEVRR